MEKNVMTFGCPEFGEIRCMTDEKGEPWFVGKDVAEKLGYANATKAARIHVDEEDRGMSEMDTPSGIQKLLIINESGLYSLILSSKLPQAKDFKKWVTGTVLPQIRKTGGYIPINGNENDNEILARALLIAQKTIEMKNKQLEEDKPKVLFADAVSKSDDSILSLY